jgi:GDP-4-dehydro-6-deoxy-D-mannose reductase
MFNLLGPGQSPALACSAFARQIALAEVTGQTEIVTGNLDASRDFVDVRDAVRALTMLAEKGHASEIYNVCSGRAVTIRKCLHEIMSMSNKQLTTRVDAGHLQKNDIPVQMGSYQKLHKATGWSPKISLKQSLSDLLNDWRRRVKEVEIR